MPTQRLVRFHGHVQGVGFRYTTREIASGYAICGYVRNCVDGTVELVAEGEAAEIKAFMSEIRSRMGQHIHDIDIQTAPATGAFSNFSIRF